MEKNKPFTPELETITGELRVINEWFLEYRKKVNPANDHLIRPLSEIECHLSEIAGNIADLVAIEFQQNVFYK